MGSQVAQHLAPRRSRPRPRVAARSLSAEEYRARQHLPATAALNADGLRALSRDVGHERRDAGDLGYLIPYQDPERLAAMGEVAVESLRETARTEVVREHRRPAQAAGNAESVRVRRAAMDERARALGYEDMAHLIEATRDVPARQLARETGIGATTITRWRGRTRARESAPPLG